MPVSSPMDTSPAENPTASPSLSDLPTHPTDTTPSATSHIPTVEQNPQTSLTTPCATVTDPRDLAIISLTAEVASMKLLLANLLSAVSDLGAENAALKQKFLPAERPLSCYSDIAQSAPSLPPP